MQKRRARRDHHTIQILLQDVVADQVLARIGAHKRVNLGGSDPWNQTHALCHPLHIHHIGDVSAATADVDADPWLSRMFSVLLPGFGMASSQRLDLALHMRLVVWRKLRAFHFRLVDLLVLR
jgi:hypothetical protein